jgi:3-oxoacyl-[acyl-carrier protein] reductase
VLVNNAGVRDDSLMVWLKDEQWDSVINTSLNSFFYVTRLVLDGMMLNRFGRIINVVSLSGLKGVAGQTNYSAAKAGVIGATKH